MRTQRRLVTVVVGTMLASATIGGLALAGHTPCDNEAIPQDIPINVGNPPVVHVGVDTGLNNGAVGLCVNVAGTDFHAFVDRDNTATPGQTVDVVVCPLGSCPVAVGPTGAETGTISGATVSPVVWADGDDLRSDPIGVSGTANPGVTTGPNIPVCVIVPCQQVPGPPYKVSTGLTLRAAPGGSFPICAGVGTTCP